MREIKIEVDPRENFTAASLMKRYADQTPGVEFGRSCWGQSMLTIEGMAYIYHHWSVTGDNGAAVVTLYLERA